MISQYQSLFIALLLFITLPLSSGGSCSIGYYCPSSVSSPIACDATKGEFCGFVNMTAPLSCYAKDMVQDSTYCPNVWTIDICPSGYSCTSNGGPYKCGSGSYSKSGAWHCEFCFGLFLTSDSGSSSCNKPAIPLIFLICGASFACMVASCVLFWVCRACHAGTTASVAHTADAARRNEVAVAAAAEAARVKEEQEAADRVRADAARPRIKEEVLERLMRELKLDLELRYPQALQVFPAVIPGSGATISADMPPELQRLIQGLGVVPFHVQSPLQSYQQFVSDSLSAQLDTPLLSQALDALILQSQTHNQIELHQAIIGIRPLILEAFPAFTAMERGEVVASKMNIYVPHIPVGVGEQQAAREAMQQRWAQELQQFVSAWMQRSKITIRAPPTNPFITQPPQHPLGAPVNVTTVPAFQLPNSVPQFNAPTNITPQFNSPSNTIPQFNAPTNTFTQFNAPANTFPQFNAPIQS